MNYARGKNPKCHTKEVQAKKRATQLKNKHPWRACYALSSRGISPLYKQTA